MTSYVSRTNRAFLSALLAVISVFESTAGAEPKNLDATVHLRVLSFNIHHGRGTDGTIDLERIATVIRRAKPDVVALQECDRNTSRSGKVDQPAELARLTKLKGVFERNINFDGGEYGNAVLSRLPIVRHANHRLPSLTQGEQRGALEVVIRLRDFNANIRFLSTHLDYRSDDAERIESVDAIEKIVANEPPLSTILAGDLNARWDSRVLDRFRKNWRLTNRTPCFTFPAGRPTRQIDYLLFRPSSRWRAIRTSAIDAATASDHRPILAELALIP